MTKLTEFSLIEHFFKLPSQAQVEASSMIELGIGDDCAILKPPVGESLLVSCDTLVEGRHFLSTISPAKLAHKSLAVNLSDLAACGGKPVAFTIAACLPSADYAWTQQFSQSILQLAKQYDCALIGGDTTKGLLTISICIFGTSPTGQAILRSGAQVGDDIYVSGTLGDARAALEIFRGNLSVTEQDFLYFRNRMELPTPRVALGMALRGIASAAIDISDGLTGDLGHILAASKVGAVLQLKYLTQVMSEQLQKLPQHLQQQFVLTGGDDYELAFTAASRHRAEIEQIAKQLELPINIIGQITAGTKLTIIDQNANPVNLNFSSFDHFE